ncbi:hypothetical protein ACFL1H_05565 [Nanoarchaeota archaeon]
MVLEKEKITTFLDDLKGNQERELIQPESTTLDKLNAVRDQFFKEFYNKKISTRIKIYIKKNYETVKKRLNELTNNLEYDQDDLKNFIFSNCNLDLDLEGPILGVYSGYLLDKLNLDFFYINGLNNKFNYLFLCSKNCKNLIIENFEGFDVGAYISTSGLLTYLNNKGRNIGIAVGSEGNDEFTFNSNPYRKINNVFYINNIGDGIGCDVADDGNASFVAFINNKGHYISESVGTNGNIDTLFAVKNSGHRLVNSLTKYGKINNIVLKDNNGDDILDDLCADQGQINNAYLINNEHLSFINSEKVKNCYAYNGNPIEHQNFNFTNNNVLKKYQNFLSEHNLNPLIKLADNPDQCTGEDFAKYLVKISEEIR